MARNFVEQILFSSDIDSMSRNFCIPAFMRSLHLEAQSTEDLFDRCIRNCRAEEGFNPMSPQIYRYRPPLLWIHIDNSTVNRPTGVGVNQRRRAIARVARHLNIGSAFEPI